MSARRLTGLTFLDLKTNSHERRQVSFSASEKTPEVCHLLGGLEHQTEFLRSDLVVFAYAVLDAFDNEGNQ